jgi:hypothetical protein
MNIPIGVAALILTALFVPESRAGTYRRPDTFGQILIMILLGTVSYAIIEGPGYGWTAPRILACFGAAAAALAAFVVLEPRRADPLVDLRFFRSLPFSGATLTALTGLCAFAGFLFLITLYLQDVRGYRPLTAGLFLLPMAAVMACSAPLAGRVIARRGTRIPLLISGAGIAAGGVLLTFLTVASPAWYVLACCVVFGIGQGWLNLLRRRDTARLVGRRRPGRGRDPAGPGHHRPHRPGERGPRGVACREPRGQAPGGPRGMSEPQGRRAEASLHASLAGLQWVADAYLLVLASLLLLAGSIADRRRHDARGPAVRA